MSYIITKNHVACISGRPVLVDHELLAGPFDRLAQLPGYEPAGTAGEIVARALAGERRPTDPRIDVDAGADRGAYMRAFLAPVAQGNPRLGGSE
jgi:hypothetical protein